MAQDGTSRSPLSLCNVAVQKKKGSATQMPLHNNINVRDSTLMLLLAKSKSKRKYLGDSIILSRKYPSLLKNSFYLPTQQLSNNFEGA
jgi:hypothetical protein